MKKITILLMTFLMSFCGYSQMALEGFESTTGPDALPSTNWTLGTGNWAVFDNGVGTVQRWGINSTVVTPPTPPIVYQGTNAAYVNRENIGQNNTSEDYLATPLVTIPTNGQLRFYTRSFTTGNQGTLYQIKVAPATASQTNPAAYSLVQQWDETTLTATYNIYEEKVVSLSAYAGQQVYVSFVKVYTQPLTTLDGDRWLIDDVRIVEQCLDPTNLAAGPITQTSATLTWGNPSGATSWEIEILPFADAPTGVGVIHNGTPSYVATATATGTPFTPTTNYKYYVRALCANGVSSQWVGPFAFSTSSPGLSCSAPIVISSLPYTTNDNTANYSDNTAIEGVPGNSCGPTNSYLNGNDVVYAYTATTNGVVNVSMTPTATYSGIFVYNSCANIGVNCVAGAGNSGTGVRTFDLAVIAGTTYYIVISTWASPQTTGYTLTLQAVNCPPPTTLSVSGINQTSANLSWANPGGATSWEVAVQTAGSPMPSGSGVQTNSNTNYPATGLASGTNYQFYVRADCGNGTFSAWAGPFLFTTAANYCAGNHFYDTGGATGTYNDNANVTTVICPNSPGDQVTVIFNSFNLESGYDFLKIYDGNSATGTLLGNFTGATIPPSFTSSAVNGCLTFVFTSDTSITTTGWDATIICGPPPTCPKPTALNISTVGQNGATVSWTEVGTATTWEVIWLPAGSPIPTATATGVITTSNTYVISGLNSATSYDVYVRAICNPADISLWSNKISFTTLIVNDECINAVNVPVNPTTTCTSVTPGSILGATASAQGNTCNGTDDDDVWFQFTATNTLHIISLLNIAGSTTDLYHVVYTGSCGALTQLYCSDNENSTASNLTIGQVYYIRVYSYTSTAGQTSTFNVCISTPVPPPNCINNQPAGNTCQTATPICNLNGYCGSTSSTYTADYWSQLNSTFCGSIENNSFLTFVATSTTISFDVWVTSSVDNNGIQIMIFSANNCAGAVNNLTCWSPGLVPTGSTNISANGLVVGNTYYIMIDGYGGDVCDYVIAANTGIQTQVNTTVSDNQICLGETVTLNSTGGNGSYNWTSNPTTTGLSATTGSTVTFTPTTAGTYTISATSTDGNTVCPQDVTDSVTIVVNDNVPPSFDTFGPYCEGATVAVLPTTSNNAINGTWTPATISNTQSGSYTFTPEATSCASPSTINVTVNPNITPTFSAIAPLCNGETAPILPLVSTNNINGTWSPSIIDNTQSGNYVFTPDANQCALSITQNVVVNQVITPTFLSPAPICSGDTAPILPTTSLNNITGTWSPAVVDNTQTATYTFTPDAGQCANPTTLVITVYQNCSFGSFASAVWLTNCEDNNFFNTVGSGASIIGPAQNIFPNTDFGTYLTNSGTFKLRGGEVKTFKIATANVCSARMNYRIYPASGTPGAFTVLNLPFFNDCVSGSFPSGGPCSPSDQKWQMVLNDSQSPVDLTAFPPGDYVIEVYYDITGDINSTTQCDDSVAINNNGANFIATYTLQANPNFTAVNPSDCSTADGSITISDLAPNTTYNLTYNYNTVQVGPNAITTDATGNYTITGLSIGAYNGFGFTVNGCSISATNTITLNAQSTVLISSTNPLTCNGNSGTIIINGLNPNQSYSVTYTDDTTPIGPLNLNSDNNGQIIITGLNAGAYANFNLTTTYCTYASSQVVTLTNPNAPVVTVNSETICFNQSTTITATTQTPGNYIYSWTVPSGFANPGNVASFTTTVAGTYTVTVTPVGTNFCNGSFENPATSGAFPNMLNESAVPCWETSAPDGILEVWPQGFESAVAYQGTQLIEINGNSTATVFQDFTTYPGAELQISFAHKGRWGNDVVRVEIGPVGGPYTSLGQFNDGNAAWVFHTLNYTVPTSGGSNYSLRFVSVSSSGGDPTVGNLLDAVSVTSTECSSTPASGTVTITPAVTLTLDSANNTQNVCIDTAIQNILYTATNATNVTASGLPTGIIGAYDNTTGVFTISGTPTASGIFNYTVTTSGGCNVVIANGTITVNATVAATFNNIVICQGDAVSLPTTSIEGFSGTWSPSTVNNTQTGTYNFTPNAGQCATGGSLTVTVNIPNLPTFTAVTPICSGGTLNALPTTSNNAINGTWTPALNNTATTTYTFTPTGGQCASTATMTIVVNPNVTPTFTPIGQLCIGESAPSLPTSSLEGISGTWTPAVIDNTVSGTYSFAPNAGQCATNGSLAVTVQSGFDFEINGSCVDNNFILEVTAVNDTFNTDNASYAWYNSNLQLVGSNATTFNVTEYILSLSSVQTLPITFSLTVTTPDGCWRNEPITLDRIFCGIQKGISVNNDGKNEFFDLRLLDVKNLTLFNRYGMKVYSKNQYKDEWKGQSDNGDDLPDGTYYYVIEFNNGSEAKTGWIYKAKEN
ncbi:fibronectin type III domain-containing protein [Flavobacterium sp. TBRC 19031]|uniref:fibronectin type III domain-containing protein n=1 Tax=Flavobacterium mekongense TaxID=3379707 RepID=UPI00399A7E02